MAVLQSIGIMIGKRGANINMANYRSIPAPPTFEGTPTVLNPANGPTIEAGEITGRDLLVPLAYNQNLQPNGLVGTVGSQYRIKSQSDVVRSWVGGTNIAAGEQVIDNLNNANYINYHHLGLKGNPDPLVQGISGITVRPYVPGTRLCTFSFSDIIAKDMSASISQINSAVQGSTYDSIQKKFFRGFGYSTAQSPGTNGSQEGLYQGPTDTLNNAESRFTHSLYEDILIVDKGREGGQFNNHGDLQCRRMTFVNVGQTDTATQNNIAQWQNCNGVVEDCIFYNAPALWNIFCHGLTIRNCSFYFNGGQGFWGRMSDQAHYDTSPYKTGAPCLIEGCYFHSFAPLANMVSIEEDECDITWTNNEHNSLIGNLYVDDRADQSTFSLSQSGTSEELNSLPIFASLNPDDEDIHGLALDPYSIDNGRGFRAAA